MSISSGDFSRLPLSDGDKEMLSSAYEAVSSVPDGWDFLKTYDPGHGGFMFSTPPPKMEEINKAVLDRYGGHSGASYGMTMRNIQFIAKEGWSTYVTKVMSRYPAPHAASASVAPVAPAAQAAPARAVTGFPYPCPCRAAQGLDGWCGVAGGGVPACDH